MLFVRSTRGHGGPYRTKTIIYKGIRKLYVQDNYDMIIIQLVLNKESFLFCLYYLNWNFVMRISTFHMLNVLLYISWLIKHYIDVLNTCKVKLQDIFRHYCIMMSSYFAVKLPTRGSVCPIFWPSHDCTCIGRMGWPACRNYTYHSKLYVDIAYTAEYMQQL